MGPGQPLKLSPVIPLVKVVENGRLKGTRPGTKDFSFHPRLEGCRKWKVGRDPGQPLKLSFHLSGDDCRKWKVGRDQGSHYSSPLISVLKVVEIGRLEGTGQPLKLSFHPSC